MGACNGYPHYDLHRPSLPPDEGKRICCLLFSRRGHAEAERTWHEDEAMLAAIAAKPDEMYGSY